MSALSRVATKLDEFGLRRPIAKIASLAYSGQAFEVDTDRRWINRQADATFVSPSIHTTRYADVHQWVLRNWAWDYVPRAGDTVIDVGAGIGEETVVFSKLVGETGRVISIEAHPDIFGCLRDTVGSSRLDNVTLVQCAVADEDGELSISTADCHVAGSVMEGGGDIKVPARSLDSLAEELGLGDVAFMKMNIEGAEKLAMRGMSRLFPRLANACISCHDFIADLGGSDDFRSKAEVRAALEAAGYTIRTRPDDPECWVRDYLYASRP